MSTFEMRMMAEAKKIAAEAFTEAELAEMDELEATIKKALQRYGELMPAAYRVTIPVGRVARMDLLASMMEPEDPSASDPGLTF